MAKNGDAKNQSSPNDGVRLESGTLEKVDARASVNVVLLVLGGGLGIPLATKVCDKNLSAHRCFCSVPHVSWYPPDSREERGVESELQTLGNGVVKFDGSSNDVGRAPALRDGKAYIGTA